VIVVSNTSPITNLAAIGQLSILRQIYGTLYIPELSIGSFARERSAATIRIFWR